jgi:tetratricopeptide (TPR) repeat protein
MTDSSLISSRFLAPAPAEDDDGGGEPPGIVPFWQRINDFFLFPFQMEPLIWAVALALVNTVLSVLPMGFLLGLLVAFATVYYFFKVAALASRGVVHSRDYSPNLIDPDWKWLPVKLYAAVFIYSLLIGALFWVHPLLGLLAFLAVLLLLPATVMTLIQSCSLRTALNPLELLTTVTDLGAQYLLLCLFLFLLFMGRGVAFWLLASTGIGVWILLPLVNFVFVYFLWVMAALIGYVMYQHHGALQIEVARQPAAKDAPALDPKALARERDAEVSALARDGKLPQAIEKAREWARVEPDNLDNLERHHRVLLLDDPASGRLVNQAQRYLPVLLEQKRGQQALQVFRAVAEKAPGFALERPTHALALAEQAWSRQDHAQTLAALRSFDKRYPGAEEIPRAYELIIRALKQGMARGDAAVPVYRALERLYPDHLSTQEAAWVLREDLRGK